MRFFKSVHYFRQRKKKAVRQQGQEALSEVVKISTGKTEGKEVIF